MIRSDELRASFVKRFKHECDVVTRAPGRVNLIGDHTDYNEGWVLPFAIEPGTWIACAARDDGKASVYSTTLDEDAVWSVEHWDLKTSPRWTAYVAGVAALLQGRGAHLDGFEMLIASDIPIGRGLASSAALEVAAALALAHICGEPMESTELIDLCRSAEREYAGVPCGLMDQTAALLARDGCALLLDCRSRATTHVPFALEGHTLSVIDSGVRHELASSPYAERQAECRTALEYFRKVNADVRALRDVTPEMVRSHVLQMDPLAAARSLHVASENKRVLHAVEALQRRDAPALGRIMDASHHSLRDHFEASCEPIEKLVARIRQVDGVLGSRMTGGGFGGAVLVLAVDSARPGIDRALAELGHAEVRAQPIRPVAGAAIVGAG